jgi:hypothetical protein
MARRPNVPYTQELVLEICRRITEGEHLKAICRKKGMPHYTTFFAWIRQYPAAEHAFKLAREMGGHWCVDTIREMCDETPDTVTDDNGVTKIDTGWVQWMRTRMDAFKWMASKFYPKMYGDSVAISGGVEVKHSVSELTDDELATIAAGGRPAPAESPQSTH